MRPRRSVLYLPGANERALEKAKGLAADALVLDLEDSSRPTQSESARRRVCETVSAAPTAARGRHPRQRPRHAVARRDLRAAAEAGPDAVVVPKVGSAPDVHAVEATLADAGAPEHTAIWADDRNPGGRVPGGGDRDASDALTVLVLGTNDLVKELHAESVPGRAPLLTSLSLCLLAARAAGKPSSTASTTTCATPRASRRNASRAASSASTARP